MKYRKARVYRAAGNGRLIYKGDPIYKCACVCVWMDGWMGGWMDGTDGWVGWEIMQWTEHLINSEKSCPMVTPPPPPEGGGGQGHR